MERLYRLCLTWALACLVSICGSIWVYGKEMEDNIDLHALSAVLADGETGRILYSKNSNEKMAMASTTKIMTCLVALENSRKDDIVIISDYAASMPDVQLNADAGDSFYIEDLLYALMLESHNDVAVAIAEHVGGSEEAFAHMMNVRAREVGCEHTNFVTSNGLDAKGHYTTAEDLAKIAIEALKNKRFLQIIQTSEHSFYNIEESAFYQVVNKNSFLDQMEGAYGVKTGFTNEAGYCFVGASKQGDENLISVVFGSGWPPNKHWKWEDTRKLMEYGFENYSIANIGKIGIDVGHLSIEGGKESQVMLKVNTYIEPILLRNSDEVSFKIVKDLNRKAPLSEKDIVGWVSYEINDVPVKNYPIYPAKTILKKTFKDDLCKTIRLWFQF